MSRRILQIMLAMIGVVPIITGIWGMAEGITGELEGTGQALGYAVLDSNFRYFSGLWLGVGVLLIASLPSIERRGFTIKLLALMIFLGGVGRVISMIRVDVPSLPFVIFTLLELLFPLFILWQKRIAVMSSEEKSSS